jgi:chromosome segregation ATPase
MYVCIHVVSVSSDKFFSELRATAADFEALTRLRDESEGRVASLQEEVRTLQEANHTLQGRVTSSEEALNSEVQRLANENAVFKENAKNQVQKAIEKVKTLTANVDIKGQEVAQLREAEVGLTHEINRLQEVEVRLTEEIQLLKGTEVRLTEDIARLKETESRWNSASNTAASLQVRVATLEEVERTLTELLAEEKSRAESAAAELNAFRREYEALEATHTAMQQTALQQQEELSQLNLLNAKLKEDAKIKAGRAMDKIKEQTALIQQLENKIRDGEAEFAKQVR